jgi:hypothetical protein
VLDGRLLPIRAVKLVRLLDEALARVEQPTARVHVRQPRRHRPGRS